MNAKIGDIIRKGRKKKGYTQKDLAEIMKVRQATVSQWENGSILHSDTFIKLVNLLDIAEDIFPKLRKINPSSPQIEEGTEEESKDSLILKELLRMREDIDNIKKELSLGKKEPVQASISQ